MVREALRWGVGGWGGGGGVVTEGWGVSVGGG